MKSRLIEKFHATFGRNPQWIARAPGRIEFIGNHTDYNGGAVLGAAIDQGVWVALAARDDGSRRFATDQRDGVVALPADRLAKQGGAAGWVNYPLGMLAVLPGFGLRVPAGFDYLAMSDLPVGAGLSSSAAIELASGLVFLAATAQQPSRETLVQVGKRAENNFVGVPCGILDQGVSGFGRKDHLVFIDCRGPEVRHRAAAGRGALLDFQHAHEACAGRWTLRGASSRMHGGGEGPRRRPAGRRHARRGAGGRGKNYPPVAFKRARHIVEEIARVAATVGALRAGDLATVGELLTASHRSSQTLFENSTPELDFLVKTLVAMPHVYGARLTGGGFGGAVMALTSEKFGDVQAQAVAATYAKKFGAAPRPPPHADGRRRGVGRLSESFLQASPIFPAKN